MEKIDYTPNNLFKYCFTVHKNFVGINSSLNKNKHTNKFKTILLPLIKFPRLTNNKAARPLRSIYFFR